MQMSRQINLNVSIYKFDIDLNIIKYNEDDISMVVVRVANKPITFPGQKVTRDSVYTYTERVIVAIDTKVITTPNPNPLTDHFYENLATGVVPLEKVSPSTDTIKYITTGVGTNPQQYINDVS